MQNLITDVLNYSRLQTSKIVFTKTDLTIITNEVVDELAELINDTNTTIEIGSLPTLNIIQNQFSQLLSNL